MVRRLHAFALLPALLASLAAAGPLEFARAELDQAIADSGRRIRYRTEISLADPGSYRIIGSRITGGDLRGLMYGLLAAADHVRVHKRLLSSRGKPAVPLRGVRKFLHNKDLEEDWYYSPEYWTAFFRMLARNRFNRFNLVFAHQTNYLAPPYPYWLKLEDFPEIVVPGLSDAQRQRNLDALCLISQTAADHGVDFTLGVWEHNTQPRQIPTVKGLTSENIGPYSYAALKRVLAACPAIRSVQVRTNSESGIPRDQQVAFYRDYVYKAIRESGRLVTLDLRGWLMSDGMLEAATTAGMPVRLSSKYWAEHIGRPYQPPETFPNYSYINFLRKPRPYGFFWEIWGLGSHRLLLWGDPSFVSRTAGTLTLSDSLGFEIDAPLAQKGYGNRPGKWGIFTGEHANRVFWKHDFERYWLFYLLWGRLTYDPKLPSEIWEREFERRFGEAAAEVLEAYEAASKVLPEIVSVHMPDPNMYVWPEINPGGLIEVYKQVLASDWRFAASPEEAVRNRLNGVPSAKQAPLETAAILRGHAQSVDDAIARAEAKLPPDHREWRGTVPDFHVLASLARYHASKMVAADQLAYFYQTSDRTALEAARRELEAAAETWRKLAAFTDGLYPPHMAFGPADFGHWKDKLPYVEHDLKLLHEREWLLDRFGVFQAGFDFGAPTDDSRRPIYRGLPYLRGNTVEPRFQLATPETIYSDERGFGWATDGERDAVPLRLVPAAIVRATAQNPRELPGNALFGDSIRGRGPQTFRVRTGPGEFVTTLLTPEGNATTAPQTAVNDALDIVFPEGQWQFSGLIVKSVHPATEPAPQTLPTRPARPTISHRKPIRAYAGRDLALTLRVSPSSAAETVRLHYRPLNHLAEFRTLDASAPIAHFTIDGEQLDPTYDLLYYFEILNKENTGWFHPDPAKVTPYYVLEVRPSGARRR